MNRKNKNKIYTLLDARAERIADDARQMAREKRAAHKAALRQAYYSGGRAPHRTDLHPRIGVINRWDAEGQPYYYIVDDHGWTIESTNIDYLQRIAEQS